MKGNRDTLEFQEESRTISMEEARLQVHKNSEDITERNDFSAYLKAKSWCDARDSLGVWRLARIKRIANTFVLVHFDGWSERWNQWYCIHSENLAPIRYYSKGYTGQTQIVLRDFELDPDHLNKAIISKLKFLMNDDKLSGFTTFDLTTFIRGDLYVLIDSIFTLANPLLPKTISQVQDFLLIFIQFCVKWINFSTRFLKEKLTIVKEDYLHFYPNAVYQCGHELMISLKTILGCEPRCSNYFKLNGKFFNPNYSILYFLNSQGLDELTKLLETESEAKGKSQLNLDFFMIWPLVSCIPSIFKKVNPANYHGKIKRFIKALKQYIGIAYKIEEIKNEMNKNPEYKTFFSEFKKLHSAMSNDPYPFEKLFGQDESLHNSDNSNNDQEEAHASMILKNNEVGGASYLEDIFTREKLSSSLISPTEKYGGNNYMLQQKYNNNNDLEKPRWEPSENEQKLNSTVSQLKIEIEGLKAQFENLKSSAQKAEERPVQIEQKKFSEEDLPAEMREYFDIIKSWKVLTSSKNYYMGKDISLLQKIGEHVDLSKKVPQDANYIKNIIEDEANYDEKEYNILICIEMLLSENKILEALNLIKWRKKILKLAQISGWNIASLISEKTLSKLEITMEDIVKANIEFFAKNQENLTSDFIS